MAIATTAYWLFGAMLLGLIAAYFGARSGEMDEDDLPQFARIRFTPTPVGRRM
ncbi:MAG: hypothetical protein NW215_05505 [Hyphomicrobiales bacterium]|nr:hypothetical protein [Hyphomicrobiales bacterium]